MSAALCIASDAVPGVLPQKLQAIAEAGFNTVELAACDLIGHAGDPGDIRKFVEKYGMKIALLACDTALSIAVSLEPLRRQLALATSLGTDLLMVNQGTENPTKEQLFELSRIAETSGVRLAVRPMNAHDADIAYTLADIGSPFLGLALNSAHALGDGSKPARLRGLSSELLFHVQLTDAGFGKLRWPGQGNLNLGSFVRVISRLGYTGPWSVTAPSHETDAALNGFRSLASLLDETRRSEPDLQVDLPDLPERIYASGFEFIEFAVDTSSADALTTMLRSMAFRMERRHISKSVELWRQGAVNIVVNQDPGGHAHDMCKRHGPTVCDMGLRVKNADQTVTRAKMLGTRTFRQSVGIGELDIPAVKGVGGNVVHFIDENSDLHRVWDIEFEPVSTTKATAPAGIRRVDHVAQTMSHNEMQSWLLTYITTFDMEKSAIVDVSDPSGLVRSQALESPEGEVRLNLNGAQGSRTLAGSFVTERMGAGVQHLAFLSDDIFETSGRLLETGFERLPISSNYYAQTQAIFDLSDELTQALRTGHILYDEDEAGAYFQLYSRPLFEGFFFEIVQRKAGYNGYGARNAPVRLAAQAEALRQNQLAMATL